MTFAYDRARASAQVRARAGGTSKIADIRYGGEKDAPEEVTEMYG